MAAKRAIGEAISKRTDLPPPGLTGQLRMDGDVRRAMPDYRRSAACLYTSVATKR